MAKIKATITIHFLKITFVSRQNLKSIKSMPTEFSPKKFSSPKEVLVGAVAETANEVETKTVHDEIINGKVSYMML